EGAFRAAVLQLVVVENVVLDAGFQAVARKDFGSAGAHQVSGLRAVVLRAVADAGVSRDRNYRNGFDLLTRRVIRGEAELADIETIRPCSSASAHVADRVLEIQHEGRAGCKNVLDGGLSSALLERRIGGRTDIAEIIRRAYLRLLISAA